MEQNQRLLIVEDDQDFAQSLKLIFSLRKITIEIVPSGEDALTRFDPTIHRVVLMDLRLPGINGAELLQAIRMRQPGTPVLVMTGCDQHSKEVELAKAAGADEILYKPFKITRMLDRIEAI